MSLLTTFLITGTILLYSSLGIAASNGNNFHLIAFGDFGEYSPENQNKVVNLISDLKSRHSIELGLLLGDNFYPYGLKSETDNQFTDKFVNIYQDLAIPFYAVLGNHDYGLWQPGFGDWRAQIALTKSPLNPALKKTEGEIRLWNMPSRYYNFVPRTGSGLTEFFALDTEPAHHYRFNTFEKDGKDSDEYWFSQLDWLRESLISSTAKWKVVFGHHPLLNDGKHGDDTEVLFNSRNRQKNLYTLLCSYADVYISGHEHSIQIFQIDCGKLRSRPLTQIISGAGGSHKMLKKFRGNRSIYHTNNPGFVSLTFYNDYLKLKTFEQSDSGSSARKFLFNK